MDQCQSFVITKIKLITEEEGSKEYWFCIHVLLYNIICITLHCIVVSSHLSYNQFIRLIFMVLLSVISIEKFIPCIMYFITVVYIIYLCMLAYYFSSARSYLPLFFLFFCMFTFYLSIYIKHNVCVYECMSVF